MQHYILSFNTFQIKVKKSDSGAGDSESTDVGETTDESLLTSLPGLDIGSYARKFADVGWLYDEKICGFLLF